MRRHTPQQIKTMNVWEHPTKPELRVYLNGMPYQPHGCKLWVEQRNTPGANWCVRVYADWALDRNQIMDAACAKIEEMVGRGCTFDQIVEYARTH